MQGPQCFSIPLYALSLDVRDDKGRTPLDMVIEKNTSAAIYLINHGSSTCGDKERGKLLCKACNSGKLDMVKELVEQHKVFPNGQHVYCFTVCITLLNYHYLCRTDVRDEGHRSPLHLACERGHKDVVQYLVEKANCDVCK